MNLANRLLGPLLRPVARLLGLPDEYGHKGPLRATAFLQRPGAAPLLATASGDGTARLWAPGAPGAEGEEGPWREVQKLEGSGAGVFGAEFLRDGGEDFLATTSTDGSAILWRIGSGDEAYKAVHIRSATPLEVVTPLALMVVAAMQRVAMAFSRDLPWNRAALRPVVVLQFALLDFSVSVLPSVQFYTRTAVAFAAVWAFLLCAFLQVGKSVALAASTFLALPLLKQLCTVLDCSRDQASGAWTLDAAPEEIVCWHGAHLALSVCAAATLLLYLPLLVPFTAAEGDLSLVPRKVWLLPSEWVRRKTDKAKGINLHAMQPRAEGAFEGSMGNLFGQVVLVFNAVLSSSPEHHLRHAAGSLAASVFIWLWTMRYPPRVLQSVNLAVHTANALGVVAFAAATASVLVGDRSSWAAPAGLYGGVICVVLGAAARLRTTAGRSEAPSAPEAVPRQAEAAAPRGQEPSEVPLLE